MLTCSLVCPSLDTNSFRFWSCGGSSSQPIYALRPSAGEVRIMVTALPPTGQLQINKLTLPEIKWAIPIGHIKWDHHRWCTRAFKYNTLISDRIPFFEIRWLINVCAQDRPFPPDLFEHLAHSESMVFVRFKGIRKLINHIAERSVSWRWFHKRFL